MNTEFYLHKFHKSLNLLDKEPFNQKQLELKVGEWHNSVVLKIQKPSWLNQTESSRPFRESVFFSVWINDEIIGKEKLYYNIHALKLRELTGYKIKSREFAEAFRAKFKAFEKEWPNVSVQLGPLTLMEGWVDLPDNFENIIACLANKFLQIQYIIDELLNERKK